MAESAEVLESVRDLFAFGQSCSSSHSSSDSSYLVLMGTRVVFRLLQTDRVIAASL